MGTRFDHVSVEKRANVYLDGKCISFTLTLHDHNRGRKRTGRRSG